MAEQKTRFTEKETNLIKATFNAEELLISIRKVMFQTPLNALDQANLLVIEGKKEVFEILRKMFFPSLDEEIPITQTVDLYYNEVEMLRNTNPQDALPLLVARKLSIEYLEQQIGILEGKRNKSEVLFSDFLKDLSNEYSGTLTGLDIYSRIVARNMIIKHVQTALNNLKVIAGQESPEETAERKKKDSSK